jgi:hypothetical protein
MKFNKHNTISDISELVANTDNRRNSLFKGSLIIVVIAVLIFLFSTVYVYKNALSTKKGCVGDSSLIDRYNTAITNLSPNSEYISIIETVEKKENYAIDMACQYIAFNIHMKLGNIDKAIKSYQVINNLYKEGTNLPGDLFFEQQAIEQLLQEHKNMDYSNPDSLSEVFG